MKVLFVTFLCLALMGVTGCRIIHVLSIAHESAQSANQPISFYGKVVDQDGNPVSTALLKISVRWTKESLPGISKDEFDHYDRVTDTQGLFSLTGVKGSLLSIDALQKEGYLASQCVTRRSFWYWDVIAERTFHPDVDKPQIFHMWKSAGPATLLRSGISARLQYDGTPTKIDLLDGTFGKPVDLQVSLVRKPQSLDWPRRNYEWALSFQIVDGGMIRSKDEQMYRAPVGGYQSKLVINMHPDEPNWSDSTEFNVYFKVHGRIYGRAEIKALLGSSRPTADLYVTSFLNPTGSQNLESESDNAPTCSN